MTELKMEDTKVGTGDQAVTGKSVTVHYTGWLTDGTKFDSSKDHGQPFTFQLGAGQVIKGWDQGVVGMKVGGVRKLTIPPAWPMATGRGRRDSSQCHAGVRGRTPGRELTGDPAGWRRNEANDVDGHADGSGSGMSHPIEEGRGTSDGPRSN